MEVFKFTTDGSEEVESLVPGFDLVEESWELLCRQGGKPLKNEIGMVDEVVHDKGKRVFGYRDKFVTMLQNGHQDFTTDVIYVFLFSLEKLSDPLWSCTHSRRLLLKSCL